MALSKERKEFIMTLINKALKNWWKILIVLIVAGLIASSCKIPTPWGVIEKGGINFPWNK